MILITLIPFQKVGTHHKYFFKFTHSTQNREHLKNFRQKILFDEKAHSLVNVNTENGCYILEVCNFFILHTYIHTFLSFSIPSLISNLTV